MTCDGSYLCRTNNIGSAWCGSTTTVDSKGCNEGNGLPHHYATAATSVPDAFSGICQLCRWSSTSKFPFQIWSSCQFICHMLVSAIMVTLCFHVPMWLPCLQMGAEPLGFATPQPFRVYPWQAYKYMPPGDGLWPRLGLHWVAASSTAWSRGSLFYSLSCPPTISAIWWGIQLWWLSRVTQSFYLPYIAGRVVGLIFVICLTFSFGCFGLATP